LTQPVHEPTQGRINQGLAFRSRQLFRRPAVGAASYALMTSASYLSITTPEDTVIVLDTLTPSSQTIFYTNNTDIFSADSHSANNGRIVCGSGMMLKVEAHIAFSGTGSSQSHWITSPRYIYDDTGTLQNTSTNPIGLTTSTGNRASFATASDQVGISGVSGVYDIDRTIIDHEDQPGWTREYTVGYWKTTTNSQTISMWSLLITVLGPYVAPTITYP
jgi:hypothetical protein